MEILADAWSTTLELYNSMAAQTAYSVEHIAEVDTFIPGQRCHTSNTTLHPLNNYETVQTYGAVGCSFCVGMGVSPVLTWMCCVTAYVGSAGPTNPLKKVCVFGLLRAAKHAGRDVQCTTCPLLHAMIGAKSRGTSAVASASTSFLFFFFFFLLTHLSSSFLSPIFIIVMLYASMISYVLYVYGDKALGYIITHHRWYVS